jgi:hypothetical protein
MLNLSIGLGVVDGGVIEPNARFGAPRLYLIGGEIIAIICNYTMRNTIMVNYTGDEFHDWRRLGCSYRPCLDPFCEFIYHDGQVFPFMRSPFKRADHVQPQTAKGQVIGMVRRAVGGMWLWLAKTWQPGHR